MSSLFQEGLNVTAIGMGVVFVLLTLLVFIIRGMSALALKLGGPPETPAAAAGPSQLPQGELIGVISAAIAMHRRRR
jgi:sodium pump decarboxylase gamma subunit